MCLYTVGNGVIESSSNMPPIPTPSAGSITDTHGLGLGFNGLMFGYNDNDHHMHDRDRQTPTGMTMTDKMRFSITHHDVLSNSMHLNKEKSNNEDNIEIGVNEHHIQ